MKRRSLRSIRASRSSCGTPATWLRRPRAAYSGIATMPLFNSCSACETVSSALPRHEAMPMPVTTTRRMSEILRGLEQAHAQITGCVDQAIVHERAAIGDDQFQASADDPADIDLVTHEARRGQHLPAELDLTHAESAAAPGLAEPRQEEAGQLPHRVQTQATG